MRRCILVLALLALAPALTYEGLEKSAEHFGPGGDRWLRLSLRAEEETRWRPATGWAWVDHLAHEWTEMRRFYTLAGRGLHTPAVTRRLDPLVAFERVGR